MGKIISVKVKEKDSRDFEYKNKGNAYDWKILVIIFRDLSNFGLPIEKTCKEFLKVRKDKFFLEPDYY